jgi:hypothetical protein
MSNRTKIHLFLPSDEKVMAEWGVGVGGDNYVHTQFRQKNDDDDIFVICNWVAIRWQ